jgi:tetratricopeptide (TPR) repeat protein
MIPASVRPARPAVTSPLEPMAATSSPKTAPQPALPSSCRVASGPWAPGVGNRVALNVVATVPFILAVMAGPAGAQDDPFSLLKKGNHEEAIEKLQGMKGDADRVTLALARAHAARGRLDEAQAVLEKRLKDNPTQADLLVEAGELALRRGRYDEVEARANAALKAAPDHPGARWLKARWRIARGMIDEANKEMEWFVKWYNDKQPNDPDSLLIVARASAEYARWNKIPDQFDFILNELLTDAASADPLFWEAPCEAGLLLLDKYNQAEGLPELRKALKINPNAVPALVGLADAAVQNYDLAEGNAIVERILQLDPMSVGAMAAKADLILLDNRTDPAIEVLERARKIHPVHEGILGRLAACHVLKGRAAEAKKLEAEILKVNPKPGEFYFQCGNALENRRQFDQAETWLRQSVAAAPHLAAPLNSLGMLFMRLGKEDEARKVLAAARTLDPFHVRVKNMISVLKHLEDYKVITTEHYEVVVSKEDHLLGEYMAEYLEDGHKRLVELHGFEPVGRSRIEIMSNHAWFSARVTGLPSIGTVGACTGRVVALASPRSLQQPYNWARVLDHEVSHVITLQQTKFNIPHWYTEAIAVLSEGFPRPQTWNQLLVDRVPKKDLLNLDTVNHAFVRPKTPLDWQMAYCQSLLYAQYMQKRFGKEALGKLLLAYRDGMETDVAIPKTFNVTKADFEKGYLEFLAGVVKEIKVADAKPPRSFAELEAELRKKPGDPDLSADLAMQYLKRKSMVRARELADKAIAAKPNHPVAALVLARMEWSIGKKDEALKILKPAFDPASPNPDVIDLLAAIALKDKNHDEAAKLYELAAKGDPLNQKWQEGLARVWLLKADNAKLEPVLKTIAAMDADNLSVRQKLATLALGRKDWAEAEAWARRMMHITVTEPESHRVLAEAMLATKRYPRAVTEFERAIEFKSKAPNLKVRLAEALARAGRRDDSMKLLQEILTAEPENAAARELKENFPPQE